MSVLAQFIPLLIVIAVVAFSYLPLGAYMASLFSSEKDWRIEKVIYRLLHVDPRLEQRWNSYAGSILALSAVSIVIVYILQRCQSLFPFPAEQILRPDQAWNTAISFATNTNWQAYNPEQTMTMIVQMVGLTVQNFVSAAVGICVAIAFARSLGRSESGTIGNFWVDITRCLFRLLLPLSIIFAAVLIACGCLQTLHPIVDLSMWNSSIHHIPGGPVASQEAIKLLGTNGGGIYNANSAHPFENPHAVSNAIEIALLLVIPCSLTRTFGLIVKDRRQGWAIFAAMVTIATLSIVALFSAQSRLLPAHGLEGKELRFGVIPSSLFGAVTTLTSSGAVNSAHASYDPFSQTVMLLNMALGEIAPGGVGCGLYGMVMVAILAVFIAGLMVGRSPEYIGKKIGPTEMKIVSLYLLISPLLCLVGTGITIAIPAIRSAVVHPGAYGVSEILYAFASASNNNGSALSGVNASHPFMTISLGIVMFCARFIPMILILALAGHFSSQKRIAETLGTVKTHNGLFVILMVMVAFIVAALTFVPVLALGPLSEGLI